MKDEHRFLIPNPELCYLTLSKEDDAKTIQSLSQSLLSVIFRLIRVFREWSRHKIYMQQKGMNTILDILLPWLQMENFKALPPQNPPTLGKVTYA